MGVNEAFGKIFTKIMSYMYSLLVNVCANSNVNTAESPISNLLLSKYSILRTQICIPLFYTTTPSSIIYCFCYPNYSPSMTV